MGQQKNTTAEDLYKLVINRRVTYEEIRKVDPVKFSDLEVTMRMLYDHGDMTFAEKMSASTTVNASLREPKQSSSSAQTYKNKQAASTATSLKRKNNQM